MPTHFCEEYNELNIANNVVYELAIIFASKYRLEQNLKINISYESLNKILTFSLQFNIIK